MACLINIERLFEFRTTHALFLPGLARNQPFNNFDSDTRGRGNVSFQSFIIVRCRRTLVLVC